MVNYTVPMLNIPWVSQFGEGADAYNNDCGAACIRMLVEGYTDVSITVDECYRRTGQVVDGYLGFNQLTAVLETFGIEMDYHRNMSKMDLIRAVAEQKPVIVLYNYGLFRQYVTTDSSFDDMHFSVIVGFDTKHFYINDPLWHDTRVAYANALPQPLQIRHGDWMKVWQHDGALGTVPVKGLDVFSTLVTMYQMKVTAPALRIRRTPGVGNNNTGRTVPRDTVVSVFAEEKQGDDLWIAIDGVEPHQQWCAARYNGNTYAVRV